MRPVPNNQASKRLNDLHDRFKHTRGVNSSIIYKQKKCIALAPLNEEQLPDYRVFSVFPVELKVEGSLEGSEKLGRRSGAEKQSLIKKTTVLAFKQRLWH